MFLHVLTIAASIALGAVIPHAEVQTLSGKNIVLPDALSGRPAILVVGFTNRSRSQTAAWGTQLAKDFGNEPRLQRLSLAVLDDVPAFVRGMVITGIRRGVPKDQHDTFLLLFHDAQPWKDLTDFKNSDEAYVLLVDPTSKVVAQTHGSPETAYAQVQPEIRALLKQN
ncbi:MAG TPA: hypothetical protein VGC72_17140 [Candidatus Elarobacter sp.]|jgi:hypothetical protein